VLFYNGDHDLLMVSRNRARLRGSFDFVIADENLVEDLVDKERFYRMAKNLDLPVPPNVTFDPKSSGPNDVDTGFPLVVKPTTRRDDRWLPLSGGGKALRVESRRELESVWPSLHAQGRVIAQSLIPGPESRIESYHVYVDGSGEPVCEFTGRKIRTFPSEFGDTSALVVTEEPDVRTLGRELVGRMRLSGVAKLDFKRDPSGKLWLLEVNPRFNLWHHAGAVAGANIPAHVYQRLTGLDAKPCTTRAGVRWCHPMRDLRAARAAGISLTGWARWASGCEAKWAWSRSDPMPFLRGVLARRAAARLRSSRLGGTTV
jgi:predicted ATP-grasp superfamily ATP-dependent carboligase